ncbi:hypothetical protein ACIP96_06430 [Streptomyces nigra]|uniref:hypothetical protein n=1 Tax=Streptomyces nigra TaxID=1827580 RepID=UPI003805DF7C
MSACTICRHATDGPHLCPRHAADVRDWLAELPAQTRLLEQFLRPAAAPAQSRIGGTGRAHSPAPVDLRVLALLGPGHVDARSEDDDGLIPILPWLDGWAGYIAYTYPSASRDPYGTAHVQPCEAAHPASTGPDGRRRGPTVTGWCVWLTRYLPYAMAHPWAGDLYRQLSALIDRLRDLTHSVPHRHLQGAPCPRCEAFALVAVDGRWGITCEACGHRMEPDVYDQYAAEFHHAHQATANPADNAAA